MTEFNTAHNKRIAQLIDIGATNSSSSALVGPSVKRKKKSVTFNDEEDIINPEDIDPTIGRFRNMVQTSFVIPKKRPSNQMIYQSGFQPSEKRPKPNQMELKSIDSDVHLNEIQTLYDEYEETYSSSSFSMKKLDLAPDVDNPQTSQSNEKQKVVITEDEQIHILNRHFQPVDAEDASNSSSFKKKYAKEAWPGRKSHSTTNSPVESSSHHYQQHQNYDTNNSPKNSSTANAPKRLMI